LRREEREKEKPIAGNLGSFGEQRVPENSERDIDRTQSNAIDTTPLCEGVEEKKKMTMMEMKLE